MADQATLTASATGNLSTAAAAAEKVVEAIAKVEGPLLTGITLFVPGAAPITVPMETILPLILPDVERALNDIASKNYGDIWEVGQEFVNHIRAGKQNSPALAPTVSSGAVAQGSQQGSG